MIIPKFDGHRGYALPSFDSSEEVENEMRRIHKILSGKASPQMCDDPNRFARPAQIQFHGSSAIFHGYQEFILHKDYIQVSAQDANLKKKEELLNPYFSPRYLKHRAVLDLGANAGLFCFLALQRGAEKAIALDIDQDYLQMLREARDRLGFTNLEIAKSNMTDWSEPADITVALALVHWVYSCTALFGSLDSVIERLAQLTKYMLIVEWVEPTDPAIAFFHHIDWNKEYTSGDYRLEAFETALANHFARYELIGEVLPTRKLYAAFRKPNEIDLSGPLPFIMDKESIIYSKRITNFGGVDYWSRIYDKGNVCYKQTTSDLAEREAYFLSQLDEHYFPRVYEVQVKRGYSVVALEKIDGLPLVEARDGITGSPAKFCTFAKDCLNLLKELKRRGIVHRDVRADNMLVRDGKPVLIDFSWAISDALPYFTPPGLGASERPPDGSFCDVYSMGKVLEQVNQRRYPEVDLVIALMAEPDGSLRVTNLNILETLFTSAMASLKQHARV